jgi:hypothetical protein
MADPVELLRASDDELRGDPLARARERMSVGEAAEQAAADRRRVEARDEFAHKLRVSEMQRRVQLAQQGYTNVEQQQLVQQAELQRQGRMFELRQELARLEGQDRGGAGWRPPGASDVDRVLEAHRAGLAEWNRPGGACMRARLTTAEAEHASARLAGSAAQRAVEHQLAWQRPGREAVRSSTTVDGLPCDEEGRPLVTKYGMPALVRWLPGEGDW